jgi:hypothetical protein
MAAAIAIAVMGIAMSANAIEVKKKLMGAGPGPGDSSGGPAASSGPAPANPLSNAQKQALQDAVASDSEASVGEESEKKSSGQNYVDLDHAKFSYMPTASTVTAKLTAPECKGKKGGASSCSKTGTEKTLVFKYKIEGSKLAQADPPKWEEASADTASKKK